MRHTITAWSLLALTALVACSDDGGSDAAAGSGGSTAGNGGSAGQAAGGNGGSPAGSGGSGGSGGVSGAGSGSGGRGGADVSGSSGGGQGGEGGTRGEGGGSGSGGQGASGSDAGSAECGAPCGQPFGSGVGCCDGVCTGLYNDALNCGKCGEVCEAATPYCSGGQCGVAACSGASCQAGETCCGSVCCGAGQICCGVNIGPFVMECHTPTAAAPSCPIGCPSCVCASPDTPIRTPSGERPIASLRVGNLVYSVDHGVVTVVPLAKVSRTAALNHHVVRVVLVNGSVLEISAPHPTADGRSFADLSPGDALGGVEVVSVETIAYAHPFTHDILPASDSGSYFAGGALIGSTLTSAAEQARAVAPSAR